MDHPKKIPSSGDHAVFPGFATLAAWLLGLHRQEAGSMKRRHTVKIDLDKLSEQELRHLNREIVNRQRVTC
jgi:hypothetical protein